MRAFLSLFFSVMIFLSGTVSADVPVVDSASEVQMENSGAEMDEETLARTGETDCIEPTGRYANLAYHFFFTPFVDDIPTPPPES